MQEQFFTGKNKNARRKYKKIEHLDCTEPTCTSEEGSVQLIQTGH